MGMRPKGSMQQQAAEPDSKAGGDCHEAVCKVSRASHRIIFLYATSFSRFRSRSERAPSTRGLLKSGRNSSLFL